jgi:formylglycine-generating enzyme required for sulfatase activity
MGMGFSAETLFWRDRIMRCGLRSRWTAAVACACVLGLLCLAGCGTSQDEDDREEPAQTELPPKKIELDLGGGVKMKLVRIPAGEFMMGSSLSAEKTAERYADKAEYFKDEHPQHRVRITRPFYMGACEVTQEQYETVMGESPSHFKGAKNPVESVSWNDATEFCNKLSGRTGRTVRLPTEAEWEYACRAGSTTAYCFGDSEAQLGDYCWFYLNSGKRTLPAGTDWDARKVFGEWGCKTHPVGQKKPNALGLYDMHGNVFEWCGDWYDEDYYENRVMTDPTGPGNGKYRVLRGGSWSHDTRSCRSANRGRNDPASTTGNYGFRVVVSPRP